MKKFINTLFLALFILITFTVFTCNPVEPPPDNNDNLPDTTSHEFSWEIDTIGMFQSSLFDVWGTDKNNIYAVGFVYLSYSPYHATNIMYWNGSNWNPIDYLEGDLISIYGFGKSDIWVCGAWMIDNNAYALISHWNGDRWQTWKFNQYPALLSIWGTSSQNMYAVGDKGLILKYNGLNWQQISTNISQNLYEIYGISENEIYAVGNSYPDFKTIVLKYNGLGWKKPVENISGKPQGELASLWGSKSNKFYIDIYSGYDSTWTIFGWPNDNTFIDKIRGTGENNIFAVGSFDLIMHYNGTSFKRYDFYKKPNGGRLFGIYAAEKSVFIVGSENAKGIVYRGFQ